MLAVPIVGGELIVTETLEVTPLTKVFVVLDPTRLTQPALEKAEWIAARNNASLLLYCCVYDTHLAFRRESQQAAVEQMVHWVDRLAEHPRRNGLTVELQIEAQPDWRDAMVDAATNSGCDLIVKNLSPHGVLARRLAKTSDWALLNAARCPVLLVSPQQPSNTSTALVAVKQKPDNAVHEQLNRGVVALAHRIAGALESDLHAVTVYKGDDIYFDRQRFADSCHLPRNRVHATEGSATRGIVEVAKKLNAGVIVIGSANPVFGPSRADTAQRVIDEAGADVIVLPAT